MIAPFFAIIIPPELYHKTWLVIRTETLDRILEAIGKYGYVLIFLGTFLIDNSGIPLFIIAAGIMVALKKLSGSASFLLAFSGLIAWDNLLYLAGIWLNRFLSRRIQKEKVSNRVLRTLVKVIDTGSIIFENNEKLFPFFCKIIPWIGKIAPALAGYGNRGTTLLMHFAIGDLWYCSVFYFTTLLTGAVIVKYSKLMGLLGFLLFLLSYCFGRNTIKKKLGCVKNSKSLK